MGIDKIADNFQYLLNNPTNNSTAPYDVTATVLKVDGSTVWVHIPGGVEETPVERTIDTKPGDNVKVRVSGGRAWITGNATNPPTDDSTANYAVDIANTTKNDVTVLNTVVAENIEATNAKFTNVEADTAKIHNLEADEIHAGITYTNQLIADNVTTGDISAATGYIGELTADNITAQDISADHIAVGQLDATYATIDNLNATNATVENLEATKANVTDLTATNAEITSLKANKADVSDLHAAEGRIDDLESTKADITYLDSDYIKAAAIEAKYATINDLHTNYAEIDLANVNNAYIKNGVFDTAAIVDEQVFTVTGNKATIQEINADEINVRNLNAKNLKIETADGYISLGDKKTPTKEFLDSLTDELNDRIDGAIETFTSTAVPTLSNYPASSWTTAEERATHVGDVCYVVNDQIAQNGYCYRFTLSGSTFSWQLIKDSDVTAALQRLQTAEGKIGDIETFDEEIATFKTETEGEISTLQTKTTTLETTLGDKVDKTTFNEVKQTVDENSASITTLETDVAKKADSSTVTTLSNTVNEVKQTADTNKASITSLTQTVNQKADGSTVTELSNRTSAVEQDLSGFKTTVSETYAKTEDLLDGQKNLYLLTTSNESVTNAKTDYLKDASGDVVTVTDAIEAPMEHLKVTLEPIQSGTGTPSPDNIRPISGHIEVNSSASGDINDDADYTTFEYLEADGNQWINTEYIFEKPNLKIEAKFLKKTNLQTNPFGVDLSGSNRQMHGNIWSTNFYLGNSSFIGGLSQALNTSYDYSFEFNDGNTTLILNGVTYTRTNNYNGWSGATTSDALFGTKSTNSSTSYKMAGRLYYVRFYDDTGTLVRDFVPARRNSDGVLGMYDRVTQKLYTNKGTGTFTVGDAIGSINTYRTDLGRTVYGGTLDVVTGELVVDRTGLTLDGSETWVMHGSGSAAAYSMRLNLSDFKFVQSTITAWSSYLPSIDNGKTWNNYDAFISMNSAGIVTGIRSITSIADWKTYLASNPLQVVYVLKEPQTYHLTPQEVKTLLGTNTVWSDSGKVSISYVAEKDAEWTEEKQLPTKYSPYVWWKHKEEYSNSEDSYESAPVIFNSYPEDLEDRVSTIDTVTVKRSEFEVTTEQIRGEVSAVESTTKTYTDGKISQEVSDRNSAITQKANEITQAVSETYQTKDDMSGYSTTSQMNSAIDQKANQITQTVSQTYQTKSAMSDYPTTSTMNSAIDQKADEITSTVSETYATIDTVDGVITRVSNAETSIQQKADSVTVTAIGQRVTTVESDVDKAQATADNKRRVFVTTPTTPYDVGDLWTQGASGDIYKCKTAKTSSQSYSASDWEKASKYTDDTTANTVATNLANNYPPRSEFTVAPNKISSTVATAKTEAITAANNATETKLQNYSTTTEMESAIEQTAGEINIEVAKKVGNDEVIAKINASTEKSGGSNLLISANKVNIEGAAIFSSGRLSTTSLNNAYDAKGDAATAKSEAIAAIPAVTYRGALSTGNGTYAKVVNCANFVLATGATIEVYTGSSEVNAAALTLNVNNTGAKDVYVGAEKVSATNRLNWLAGSTITFVYSGAGYVVVDNPPAYCGETCTDAENVNSKYTLINRAVLYKGTTVTVPMTNTNTASTPVLRIKNSSGTAMAEANIYYGNSTTAPTKANGYAWLAGSAVSFVFDGQYWRCGNQTFINGGNILTGTVTADQIASNAITARHIAIGDYDNFITATEKDEASLDTGGNPPIIQDGWLYKQPSYNNLWLSPTAPNWMVAGEKYRITGTIKTPAAGKAFARIFGRDASDAYVTGVITPIFTLAANTEVTIDETVIVTTGLADCIRANVGILFYQSDGTTLQGGYCKNMRCVRIDETDGRNYCAESIITPSWTQSGISALYEGDGSYHIYGTPTATNGRGVFYILSKYGYLGYGDTFTFSASGSQMPSNMCLYVNFATASGTASVKQIYGGYGKNSVTFTTESTHRIRYIGVYWQTSTSAMDVRFKFKLERGDKATDWSQAPDDVGSYITYVNATDGIKVHNASDTTNYVQVNSDGMNVVKGETSVSSFGETVRLGTSTGARVIADSSGIGVYNASNARKMTIDGTGIRIYGGNWTYPTCNINASSAGLYVDNDNGAYMGANGFDVKKGGVNVGRFGGDSIRIGAESTRHVEIKDGGLEVLSDANNTVGVFGYGSGKTASGTMDTKPYFTLGTRAANSVVGNYSFASGILNEASAYCAVAEGHNCIASGVRSHAEGVHTKATNDGTHAEGYHTEATGSYSHAQGYYTIANGVYQFVTGRYNVKDTTNKYYMIIGGGTSDTNRKNLFAVDNSGYVYVNGTQVHSSDRRLKEHLSYLNDDAIRFIDELKPAHYIKDGRKHVGFYAQDVEKADEWDCMTDEDANGYMTLSYMEILAPLVAYVQRLEKRIEELEGGNICT